jgi:hypothetical protein
MYFAEGGDGGRRLRLRPIEAVSLTACAVPGDANTPSDFSPSCSRLRPSPTKAEADQREIADLLSTWVEGGYAKRITVLVVDRSGNLLSWSDIPTVAEEALYAETYKDDLAGWAAD